jgi:hypothetical protein
MLDLFLLYAYQDKDEANGIADHLAGRGLTVGKPVSLWPPTRLLPLVDQGLVDCRRCLVLLSKDFLKMGWARKDLDGLAGRKKVVSLLVGIDEEVVATHSPSLATAAIPGTMTEQLVNLLRR